MYILLAFTLSLFLLYYTFIIFTSHKIYMNNWKFVSLGLIGESVDLIGREHDLTSMASRWLGRDEVWRPKQTLVASILHNWVNITFWFVQKWIAVIKSAGSSSPINCKVFKSGIVGWNSILFSMSRRHWGKRWVCRDICWILSPDARAFLHLQPKFALFWLIGMVWSQVAGNSSVVILHSVCWR